MENYRFTAFEKTGETLFDEVWTFDNDQTAKVGKSKLKKKELPKKHIA